jgi:hypothetical protein
MRYRFFIIFCLLLSITLTAKAEELLTIEAVVLDTTICEGDSISLSVNIPDAVTYNWSPANLLSCSDCPNPVTEPLFGPEEFIVTVTNSSAMDSVVSIFVNVRSYLDFSLLPFTNSPVCEGDTLLFDSNVFDGQSYDWSGPGNFSSTEAMPFIASVQASNAGSYTLDLVDDIGCEAGAQFDVIVYPAFNIATDMTGATCGNTCDGAVTFNISGGEPPYQVSWDNGISWMTDLAYTEICSGVYNLLVRDVNCEQAIAIEIGIDDPIFADFNIGTPNCNDLSEVQIEIFNLSGGTGMEDNYSYSIDGGTTFEPVPDIPFFISSNVDTIIIEDETSCQQSFPIDIVFPAALNVDWSTTNPSCLNNLGGTFDLEVTGGSPPYFYDWNLIPPPDLNNLPPGQYALTITDSNDCFHSLSFDLTTSPIDDVSRSEVVICPGDEVQLDALIPNMVSVSWSPAASLDNPNSINPVATPQEPTIYYVTAEDTDGCMGTDSISVYVYPEEVCLEVFYDTIPVGTTGGWCSNVRFNVLPSFQYMITEIDCTPDSNILELYINDVGMCVDYEGISPGTDSLCLTMCSAFNEGPCMEAYLYLTVEDSHVWPGDTDTNGVVNNFDLLPIGLAYDSVGPPRPNASLSWEGQPSPDWVQQTVDGTNYKHIDTDGDGIIADSDTLAITLNWGLEHDFASENEEERLLGSAPFYIQPDTLIEGQTIYLPVILGEMDAPANGVYGLAFSLLYDADMIKDGTALFTMDTTWIGTPGDDALFIQRNFDAAGRLDVGITRINGIDMDGEGQIGSLIVTLEDDILSRNIVAALDVTFEVANVRIISSDEEVVPVATPVTNAPVFSTVSNDRSQNWKKSIHLFPNPASSAFQIRAKGIMVQQVSLFNTTGKLCQSWGQNMDSYPLNSLASGLYYVQIKTDKGTSWQRLVIH